MAQQKEARFKQELKKKLEEKKAYVRIASYSVVRGIPDLETLYKGNFYALELKVDDGPVTALQKDSLEVAARNGAHSFIVRLCDDGIIVERATGEGVVKDPVVLDKKVFKDSFPEILLTI